MPTPFSRDSLSLDAVAEVDNIAAWLNHEVHHSLRRYGAVVGISGGIDSSVVLALCVKAFGSKHVLGVMLPEKESSPESAALARQLADQFEVEAVMEDISDALDGAGCYARRDEAIRRVVPGFGAGWTAKIALAGNVLEQATLNVFRLIATEPDGTEHSQRLPVKEFAQIVAASNFKQRLRMSMLYYHAEVRNYAVIGTAQKNEHDLGFFVKHGDGGADLLPLAHLFKTQVYQLARALNVPAEIQARTPTTDTYPGGQTQEEFFYRLPFALLDAIWLGHDQGVAPTEIAAALDLTPEQVERVITDIESKRRATEYLRAPAGRLSA